MSTSQPKPLRIAITGATGLIGRRLATLARQSGHTVYELRRPQSSAPVAQPPSAVSNPSPQPASAGISLWNPATGELSTPEPIDILIHLAGRNVAARWTHNVKKEIRDSRVLATQKLCAHLASLPPDRRPRLLISASAIGIYGNRGEELLTEASAPAPLNISFLADVCRDWEAATQPAQNAGIRVTHFRIGVVLAKQGGALAKLKTPTKLGLAGPVGPGTQFIPWISLTDITRLLLHLAQTPDSPPILNAVTPPPGSPIRQHEFIRTLAQILHRPALFPLPSFMVNLAFGQMGAEMLLSSLRVVPTKLPPDFTFHHPTLESAIRAELAIPS